MTDRAAPSSTVHVIGAGPAGLMAAERLAARIVTAINNRKMRKRGGS